MTTADPGPVIAPRLAGLIAALPKTELHVHLEGTLEPEAAIRCARRNGVELPWATAGELRAAYRFADLPGFLRVLFRVAGTLRTRDDFYDLAIDYLRHAAADRVVRAEVFFGSQPFLDAGVSLAVMLDGVLAAFDDARQEWGIDAQLICTAQRHRSEQSALELLDLLEPWRDSIIGVGLGSAERGNPPAKFARYFQRARLRGYRLTLHAGEDGPAEYIREALDVVRPDRIDHGVTIANDAALIARVRDEGIGLTMCPLSNVALRVVGSLAEHPLGQLLRAGLLVTINSDDPPFFGGYLGDNYRAVVTALRLDAAEVVRLAGNGIRASFLPTQEKCRLLVAVAEAGAQALAVRPRIRP